MRRLARTLALGLLGLGLLFGASSRLCAQTNDAFFFKSGDRVLFLGDSITAQYQYSSDIELYLTTRFPKWNLVFLNAGIGGDTAGGGKNRFANHVLADKPTAVTINFGMNDGGYGALNTAARDNFAKNTEDMLKAAKEAGVRVAVVSPNAVDTRIQERFKLYLETQKEFYAPLKDVAAKNGAAFVDQYAVTRKALERMQSEGATKVIPFGDGFHTSSPGGLLMAHAILTGLNAPALVSDAEIGVAGGQPKTQKCTIENVKASANAVAFDRTDEALPIPVQNDWVSLLPYVNELKDLNWYGLKVTGLAPGKYTMTIDGEPAGEYTSEGLALGVNLGNLTIGPIYGQGMKVLNAITAKNGLVNQRFFGVITFNPPDWLADVAAERKPKVLASKLETILEKQAEIYKLAQPVKHRFELTAAK